jgi:hypothetical protein
MGGVSRKAGAVAVCAMFALGLAGAAVLAALGSGTA